VGPRAVLISNVPQIDTATSRMNHADKGNDTRPLYELPLLSVTFCKGYMDAGNALNKINIYWLQNKNSVLWSWFVTSLVSYIHFRNKWVIVKSNFIKPWSAILNCHSYITQQHIGPTHKFRPCFCQLLLVQWCYGTRNVLSNIRSVRVCHEDLFDIGKITIFSPRLETWSF